jgi:hypothetical protein
MSKSRGERIGLIPLDGLPNVKESLLLALSQSFGRKHYRSFVVTRPATLTMTSGAMPEGRTELQRYQKPIGRGVLPIPAIGCLQILPYIENGMVTVMSER